MLLGVGRRAARLPAQQTARACASELASRVVRVHVLCSHTRRILSMHLLQDEWATGMCILPRRQIVPGIIDAQMRGLLRAQRGGHGGDRSGDGATCSRGSSRGRGGRSASESDGGHDHTGAEERRGESGERRGEQWCSSCAFSLVRVRVADRGRTTPRRTDREREATSNRVGERAWLWQNVCRKKCGRTTREHTKPNDNVDQTT